MPETQKSWSPIEVLPGLYAFDLSEHLQGSGKRIWDIVDDPTIIRFDGGFSSVRIPPISPDNRVNQAYKTLLENPNLSLMHMAPDIASGLLRLLADYQARK